MVFSGARSERNVENRAGLACWLLDLMLDFFATGRVRRQYCKAILWGGPNGSGRNPSEDFYANLARHLQAPVKYT